MLAKLRVTEAAEILALSTVRGQGLASLGSGSSLVVGMVAVEPPKMDQLRQLALPKSVSNSFVRTCFGSLTRNFAKSLTVTSWSLPIDSLTLPSLSRTGDRFHSLTLHSLSLPRGNLESLTLQSLSSIDENCFQRISFKEVIFGKGSLEETDEGLAHKLAERRAGTNSFSNLAVREVGTNSFSNKSFAERVLSLQMRLKTSLFRSFQLTCAALLLGTYSVLMSFPNESLQSDELAAAYSRDSFQHQCIQQDELEVAYMHGPMRANQLQQHSLQQQELCRSSFQSFSDQLSRNILDSLLIQLDLVTSLSLTWFGSTRCRKQLQSDSFDRSSFEHRALPCAALLATTLVAFSLGAYQYKSFQLPMQQLYLSWTQGGAYPHRALSALTLISLSLAINAWLKTSSKRAWIRRSLPTRSSSTTSFTTASTKSATNSATRSLQRTLLSVVWFSFLINNIFIGNSFWRKEPVDNNELSETVWEQELEEHLAAKPLQHNQLQQNKLDDKKKNKKQQDQLSASVPDRELS